MSLDCRMWHLRDNGVQFLKHDLGGIVGSNSPLSYIN